MGAKQWEIDSDTRNHQRRPHGQAAGWKRTRAWSARAATRSGPSTAGSWRSMPGRRRADTTGTPSMRTLPQGTWAPWTATIGTTHLRVGQDLGGSIGLERHRTERGAEGVAAMPQPPGWVELQAAAILLGVDHEHPTGANHQVVKVGLAARDGQIMQDRPSMPLQGTEQPGGAPLPRRPATPDPGVRAGPEPQPPAGCHGREHADHQAEPGHQQAAKESPTSSRCRG